MATSADAPSTSTWELGILRAQTLARADALATEAVDAARSAASSGDAGAAETTRGIVRTRRGHLTDALADLGLAHARTRHSGGPVPSEVLAALVEAHLATGALWEAEHLADDLARAILGTPPGLHAAMALHAQAELSSARRDHATAWLLYADAGKALGAHADDPAVLSWRLGAAVAGVHLGLRVEVDARLATQRHLAAASGRDHVLAATLRLQAALAGQAERRELLEAALACTDPVDAPRLAAQVAVDLAAHLTLTGAPPDRAVELLHAAGSTCREHRLTPLLARVERLQQRLGVTPVPHRPDRSERLGGLQLLLARLTADGCTDADIAASLLLDEDVVRREVADACRRLGVRARGRIGSALTLPAQPAGSET